MHTVQSASSLHVQRVTKTLKRWTDEKFVPSLLPQHVHKTCICNNIKEFLLFMIIGNPW